MKFQRDESISQISTIDKLLELPNSVSSDETANKAIKRKKEEQGEEGKEN